jgi:hypothetical protein
VLLPDELKEEESIWRLWLDAVGPCFVDTAESTVVKSSDVVIAVDHGLEAESVKLDVVFGSDFTSMNVELSVIEEESSCRPPFVFLAMASMAPMSAAVTNTAARQTAMKHRMVRGCQLSLAPRGWYAALSTLSMIRMRGADLV